MTQADTLGCPSGLGPGDPDNAVQDPSAFVREQKGEKSLDLLVRGARCGGCLNKIEQGVGDLPGIDTVRLNLSTGRLHVEWSGTLKSERIVKTLTDMGYGAAAFDPGTDDKEHLKTEKKLLIAMAVAGFAAANVMLLSVAVWGGVIDMNDTTRALMHWVSGLIAIPSALFAGQTFFASAINSIKARHLNMDVPISLAVILALGMSLIVATQGGEHTYFDAAVTLLFFLLIGRFLDARLRRRAFASANALAAMQAATATRIDNNGNAKAVKASDINPGDVLLVSAGERLIVDAEIVEGATDLDARMVTGEVEPVAGFVGQKVHAGTINLSVPIRVRATGNAENSLMADIGRMLEAGEQKRSAYRRIADKAAEIYVPTVHATAAVAFIGWMLAGATLQHSVFVAVTVLIITCPCALALAAPVVQVVASSRLFKDNVFLSSGDALERLATVDHVVFDKTGTLTLGDPVLVDDNTNLIDVDCAAHLARASRHPFSRALVKVAGAGSVASNIEEFPGRGVAGSIGGRAAKLGSAEFVLGEHVDEDKSRLWFQREGSDPVAFEFVDVVRPDAKVTIEKLNAMGVSAEIVSGDAHERVEQAARMVGIDQIIAGASPQEKAARLDALERDGQNVLMVGDGLNDAGALSKAHASLAPGGAVDVSRLASDGVFSGDSLSSVSRVLEVARNAKKRMVENFGFAVLYNAIAIPIALAGWATPMVAAIAMSSSSIIVTLNALRLSRMSG